MTEGSRVVCVDDSFSAIVRQIYQQLPVKDKIYTIRAVYPGRGAVAVVGPDGKLITNGGGDAKPEIGVLLRELHNQEDPFCAGRELGFNAERFAPLQEAEADGTAEEVKEYAGAWQYAT